MKSLSTTESAQSPHLLLISRRECSLVCKGPLNSRLCPDSAVDRDFTPLCYTITCMHLRCAEKAYSCSLEFCLGGFYNKRQLVFCPVLFLRPECVCVWSVSCVLFCVISLVISNIWHPTWGSSETERVNNPGGILNP